MLLSASRRRGLVQTYLQDEFHSNFFIFFKKQELPFHLLASQSLKTLVWHTGTSTQNGPSCHFALSSEAAGEQEANLRRGHSPTNGSAGGRQVLSLRLMTRLRHALFTEQIANTEVNPEPEKVAKVAAAKQQKSPSWFPTPATPPPTPIKTVTQ